uniref:NADH-ubiquinone oxidoreductase chain 1 n=1 Tax=Ichthyophthirius multifiliis TaxID=5932 RepID=G1FLE3_ICHMU|nr:NADH dehydrogenase subunit 1 [Ichthyophthirius multifiliis]AEL89285.1 NADH dehydrogenase subunit 1 [Ichthyophthirius multifiliis]
MDYFFYIYISNLQYYLNIIMLIYNIICMLLITLVIASITLIERKVLSLIQRRVGPQFVGYRGRLQYIADALKLFIKGVITPEGSNKFWFVAMPSIAGAICYTFWINSIWGPSVSIFEIEYNLVYASLMSIMFGYCIILTGYFSKSKYAFLASIRCAILLLNIEIFLGLLIINLVFISESFCFTVFVSYQEFIWFIILFFGISGLIFITFLLETNRSPFDLAEAESELVTGYTVEYGGFYFALYYLGEYFHLFFFSMIISVLLLGGWELPNIIYYYILNDFEFYLPLYYDIFLRFIYIYIYTI